MTAERDIQHEIRLQCGRGPTVLWRNEVGVSEHGWRKVAAAAIRLIRARRLADAIKTLLNPKLQRVRYGLCKGSSDLIGLHEYTITPSDVGRTVALFLAVEVKTDKGKTSDDQDRFNALVRRRHGLAVVARSPDDVTAALP